jgi:hypothetical protein
LTPDEPTPDSEELQRRVREELGAEEAVDGEEVAPAADTEGGLTAEYMEYSHSGPLPGIPWFEAVERLAPGSAEKIVDDFTEERKHQRALQKEALIIDARNLDAFSTYQRLRLVIVGLLAGFIAIAGVALILLDKEVYGLVLLVGEIAGMVLAFFGRRKSVEEGADSEDIEGPL